MTNQTCLFCAIVNKKLHAGILYEDDKVMAFLDIRPVNEGHTLIIPKDHYETIDLVNDEAVYNKLFMTGKKIQLLLKEKLDNITGFNYLIANGRDAGQEVFHVHLHIIPRKTNDGFGFKFGPNYGILLSEKEKDELTKKLLS